MLVQLLPFLRLSSFSSIAMFLKPLHRFLSLNNKRSTPFQWFCGCFSFSKNSYCLYPQYQKIIFPLQIYLAFRYLFINVNSYQLPFSLYLLCILLFILPFSLLLTRLFKNIKMIFLIWRTMLFQVSNEVFLQITFSHSHCIGFFNIFFPYNFTRVKSECIRTIYFTLVTLVFFLLEILIV